MARRRSGLRSHRVATRNVRRQLRGAVYKTLGISRAMPTLTATNKQVLRSLHPTFDRRDAMYSVAHDFSILPAVSRAQFVDMPKVRAVLMQDPKIKRLIEIHPKLEVIFDRVVEQALTDRGFKRTAELWMKRKAIARGIKTIDARAKGYSERMNLEMGKVGSALVSGEAAPVIFDVGTGAGSTIISVVGGMPRSQRANAKVVISDVIPTALRAVKKHLVGMGVKPENVVIFPVGFNHVCSTLRTMPRQPFLKKSPGYGYKKRVLSLTGKIDLVVSGATFNCFPGLKGILRGTKRLLKNGGRVAIWDWAGIETTARGLTKAQLDRRLFVTEGNAPSGRENLLAFSQYWLRSYIVDDAKLAEAFARLEKDVATAKGFDFIEWAGRNQGLFEKDWKKIEGKGRRQRGYRTTGQFAADMRRAGFAVERVFFPLYEPNKITQGNNQYIMGARK